MGALLTDLERMNIYGNANSVTPANSIADHKRSPTLQADKLVVSSSRSREHCSGQKSHENSFCVSDPERRPATMHYSVTGPAILNWPEPFYRNGHVDFASANAPAYCRGSG